MTDGAAAGGRRRLSVRVVAVVVALAAVLATIAAGEWLLARLHPITAAYRHDPVTEYRFRPGLDIPYRTAEFATRIRIGGDGLRLPAAGPGRLKVLFLGDSFVFGHGVEGEQAVPHRLEALSGGLLSVTNAGIPGYDTRRQAMLMQSIGASLKPDVVVVGFVINDVLGNSGEFRFAPTATGAMRHLPFPALGTLVEYLAADPAFVLSRLGIAMRSRFDHLACARDGGCREGWRHTAQWLATLVQSARQSGARRVVLVRMPVRQELDGPNEVAPRLAAIAAELGIDFIDLAAGAGLDASVYYPRDGHWSVRGHELAAAFLWRRLGDLGIAGD